MTECLQYEDLQIEDDLPTEDDQQTEDDRQTNDLQDRLPLFSPDVSGRASKNAAVARCCAAFNRAFLATLAGDLDNEISARADGNEAYRKALPPLHGDCNIRNFIACVAHGVLINVISDSDAHRVLYAARIAHSMSPKKSEPKKSAPRAVQPGI